MEIRNEIKGKEVKKKFVQRSLADIQRAKLNKLMENPDKPVIIPEVNKKDKEYVAPSFIRNVMGSSAGAGSGEFHVYRHLRRKEFARQKLMKTQTEQERLDEEFQEKLDQNQREAEERTNKKRQKRLKKKKNQKNKGKKQKLENSTTEDDEEQEEQNSDSDGNLSNIEETDHKDDENTTINENDESRSEETQNT
ncbi:hypothetical protein PVAND_013166 [Polypedilum vanderplanki]|uniref:Uncharacterized protein n=1 Tax=Polypedilum vanderplanki TaxID=319348 RepID=A0A9J6CQN3_POLVA|nr:hypothetical protein PVAND_013166 [Polypedilum vanderplanki]